MMKSLCINETFTGGG